MSFYFRSLNSTNYRYGYNGQEKSLEIDGNGNHNTAEFWEMDTRSGRRWNLDPVLHEWRSDYSIFGNNPILLNDPDGDDTPLGDFDTPGFWSEVWGGVKSAASWVGSQASSAANFVRNNFTVDNLKNASAYTAGMAGAVSDVNNPTIASPSLSNIDNLDVSERYKETYKETYRNTLIAIITASTATGVAGATMEGAGVVGVFLSGGSTLTISVAGAGVITVSALVAGKAALLLKNLDDIKNQNTFSKGGQVGGGGGSAKGVEVPKGFEEVKGAISNGQKVYKKGQRYISRDIGQKDGSSHNGGIWKELRKVGSKFEVTKTLDKNLNIIKVYK